MGEHWPLLDEFAAPHRPATENELRSALERFLLEEECDWGNGASPATAKTWGGIDEPCTCRVCSAVRLLQRK